VSKAARPSASSKVMIHWIAADSMARFPAMAPSSPFYPLVTTVFGYQVLASLAVYRRSGASIRRRCHNLDLGLHRATRGSGIRFIKTSELTYFQCDPRQFSSVPDQSPNVSAEVETPRLSTSPSAHQTWRFSLGVGYARSIGDRVTASDHPQSDLGGVKHASDQAGAGRRTSASAEHWPDLLVKDFARPLLDW